MLTINNIERISNYSSATISVETTNWAYIFQIENKFGSTHQITLSRIHPPQKDHPHRNWYCMTYDGQQMWLQKTDLLYPKKFIITMTRLMANII
jgi:hypothetical protein